MPPHIFTNLTWPISLFCCKLGIQIIFYLDDTIIMACSRKMLIWHRYLVLSLFCRLGLQVNLAKSDLSPAQDFIFLGLCWNTVPVSISLTPDKVTKLRASVARIVARGGVSCWRLQKYLGLANFTSLALPHARLFSRSLQHTLSVNYLSLSDCFRWCLTPGPALREL